MVGPEDPNDKGVIIAPILKASIPADSCATAKPAPASSVDELVAAVEARDDWVISEPVDVTIGGYSGKHRPRASGGRDRLRESGELQGDSGRHGQHRGWWAQGPSNRFNLWILDVGGRPVVVMRNSYASPRPSS